MELALVTVTQNLYGADLAEVVARLEALEGISAGVLETSRGLLDLGAVVAVILALVSGYLIGRRQG